MTDLSEVGLQTGVWVEAVVSTYFEKTPHAAAMGCLTPDGTSLVLKPFTDTQTFKNLLKTKSLVVNITHDPVLFYKVVFGEKIEFGAARFVDAPVVKEATAWIEALAVGFKPISMERVEVSCKVKNVEAKPVNPTPYSRAEHALIESLIHYTRVKVFKQTGRYEEVSKLVDKIRDYEKLVKRVSSNPLHLAVIDRIVAEVDKLVAGL
ncbi:MAG: DUF447 family protein [Candidatus Caldarchaeum sp.]